MPTIRHDNSAPSVLGLTVAAFIFDVTGRVLLIKENYGRRRYGPPGGTIEAGENPKQALIRETLEETCMTVAIAHLIGVYHFVPANGNPWMTFALRSEIEHGQPAVPNSGEIAEVAWFDPYQLPSPLTNLVPYALPDALRGARGIVSDTIYLS